MHEPAPKSEAQGDEPARAADVAAEHTTGRAATAGDEPARAADVAAEHTTGRAATDAEVGRETGGAAADVVDLGRCEYQAAWDRQLALVETRKTGEGRDTLLLVEHPHVITLGRRRSSRDNILAAGDVPIVEIERGGDVTYHGPGQLVAYPVLLLHEGERDLHAFLRNIEEGVIQAARTLGVADAGRKPGATGVWIGDRKLASIGIACRRWVTFHGVAVNVSTDLSYFQRMNPCGFQSNVMTSLTELLNRPITIEEFKLPLIESLSRTLGRTFTRRTT